MKLKDACISRDGVEEGTEVYNQIIADCKDAVNSGNCMDVEEILYDAGFEPDYIFDVLETIA